jgi:hypothetical protein
MGSDNGGAQPGGEGPEVLAYIVELVLDAH